MNLSEAEMEAVASGQLLLDQNLLARLDRQNYRKLADRMGWFHGMDLSEFQTSGRFPPGEPQNSTLFPVFDLLNHIEVEGCDCLDIGCYDGLVSFGLKQRGAASVVATDTSVRNTFLLARHLLRAEVEYYPGSQIKDFEAMFDVRRFDLIVCAGVIYHMLHPLTAFTVCRKLLKRGGLLVLETAYNREYRDAVLVLNSEAKQPFAEPHTYWLPTEAAVVGMAKLVGLDVVAVRVLKSPTRLAILAQSVMLEEVQGRSPLLEQMHEVDFSDLDFKLQQLESENLPQSQIGYSQPKARLTLDRNTYVPDFPPHPLQMNDVVGKTKWTTKSGNLETPLASSSGILNRVKNRLRRR